MASCLTEINFTSKDFPIGKFEFERQQFSGKEQFYTDHGLDFLWNLSGVSEQLSSTKISLIIYKMEIASTS